MSWEHLTDTTPRARTRHCCSLCDRHINPGHRYVVKTFVADGKFVRYTVHESCAHWARDWSVDEWKEVERGDPAQFNWWVSAEIAKDEGRPVPRRPREEP
jgi:hypothetical protein